MEPVTGTPPALSLEQVSCSYGGLRSVVDQVSFDVAPGEVVALVGPNGAGKTTLLNVINGIHPLDSGRIHLGGTDVSSHGSHRRARGGMSRSFQLVRLFGDLSANRNIELGRASQRSPGFASSLLHLPQHRKFRTDASARTADALGQVGLTELAKRRASDVSHGQSRRIEIARAVVSNPSVLLLDEPTSGLHAAIISSLVPIVKKQAEAGVGVLLVEHNLRFVKEVSSRVVVMDRGRVIADGVFDDVVRRPNVIQAYLGGDAAQFAELLR